MDTPGNRALHRRLAAQQVLADCVEFRPVPEAVDAWERMNQQPALSLKGLRELMDRPSAF